MGGQVPSDEPLTQKNKNKTQTYRQVETGGQLLLVLQSRCGITPPTALLFLILSNMDFRGFSNSNIPESNISRVQWPALCKLNNVCC